MDKVSILKNIGVVLLLIASSLYYFLQTGVIELNNKKDSPKSVTSKKKLASKETKIDKASVERSSNDNIIKSKNNEIVKDEK